MKDFKPKSYLSQKDVNDSDLPVWLETLSIAVAIAILLILWSMI